MTDDAKTLLLPNPVLPEPPPEEYPRPFGNYLLLAPLARGGMGEVFLAKHGAVAGLEKHCVVKTLRPHLTDDREYTSRFIDEARIVVQLGHRNICHVFDVGTVGERYYLAMEFINGKDLRALAGDVGIVEADGTKVAGVINPGLALHIVSETLEALDYAHRQIDAESGTPLLLVHRDVSPQNVMLSWEGEVKLIDFGLAASTLKVEQTSPNVVMGKLAYMAPEQVRGERVDGRADLFAAGVMLYELLMGERFYEGRSPYEIWGIAAQGGYRPRGWSSLNDDMKLILDRALAGSSSARYPTCNEMREALQGYLQVRGLRGDAPMLRALMQTVYATAIEESRRTLSILTKAKVAHRVATASGATSGPSSSGPRGAPVTEPTVSLVRSPSQSIENKRMLAAAAGEGTEPTEMMVRPSRPTSRTSIAAAAAGLLAVAAIVALVAALMQEKPAVVATPVTTPVSAPLTAPVTAPVIAPVVEPVIAPVAPEEPAVVDPVETVKATVKKGVDKKPKKPKVEPVVTKPVVTKPVVTKEVAQVEPAPVTWKSAGGWGKRVEVLAKSCASHACTGDIAKHREDWGSLGGDAFKAWKQAMQACWTKCGLP